MSKFPKFGQECKPADSVSIMNSIQSRQINPPENTPLSSLSEIKNTKNFKSCKRSDTLPIKENQDE